jgi:hypothetical protein
MRGHWLAVLMSLIGAVAQAADAPVAIYDPNPEHLWNRLYRAIAMRAENGVTYGADNAVPFREPFDDPEKLTGVLDEFLEHHGEKRSDGDIAQALLLSDVWAAFDLAVSGVNGPASQPIERGLARVIGRLRMQESAISHLPDNYAQAVQSGQFASDFDPSHPNQPFLPADLFDPGGPWVQIQDGGRGGLVTPFHTALLSGRSVFLVFIRCPGGRPATLSYLQTLDLYPTPFEPDPSDIGTSHPSGQKVRMNPLRLNRMTPQFPEGTIVALVRQMVVINEQLQPVPTSITQQAQFRVYRSVGVPPTRTAAAFDTRQQVYEFVMRRKDLLSGGTGGLHSIAPGQAEYDLMPGEFRPVGLAGPPVLTNCGRCHFQDGIFSVGSYDRGVNGLGFDGTFNPQLLPAGSVPSDDERTATVHWKQEQFNWGLLRGLLEAEVTSGR